jgi:tetratricopeptide (TPR) repeat protein
MGSMRIASGFLLAIVLTASAQDKITLQSGVQSGAVVKVDFTTVTLRTAQGDIAFPRKDIKQIELQKPPEVDAAFKAVEAKKFAEAIPALKAVTDKYLNLNEPWLQQAWATLGDSQAASAQWPAAIETYKKLLELYPQTPLALKARIGLSQGLVNEKKHEDALKLLEPAVAPLRKELKVSDQENKFLGTAMIVLGDCYRERGELSTALECYLSTVVLYYQDAEAVRLAQERAEDVKKKLKS